MDQTHQMTPSKEAYVLVTNLIKLQKLRRKVDVERGHLLFQLHSNRLYQQAFGEGIDSWEEFLRSPEIGLTVSEANRAMQMYEYFVIKYSIPEDALSSIPVRSLTHLLPKLKKGTIDKETLEELVSAAKELTFFEFKERIYDIESDGLRTYSYMVMRRCNETKNLSRVQEISNEDILSVWPQINDKA